MDPPQSAEIDRFDVEDLAAAAAAAAMSTVLLDEEALALERLGAMGVRAERAGCAARGKERSKGEEKFGGERDK